MSPFIEVELPDGTIIEFPEGTPEDVMARVAAEASGTAAPAAAPSPQARPAPVPDPSLMSKGPTGEVARFADEDAPAFNPAVRLQEMLQDPKVDVAAAKAFAAQHGIERTGGATFEEVIAYNRANEKKGAGISHRDIAPTVAPDATVLEKQADFAQDGGMAERLGDLFTRGTASWGAGVQAFGGAIADGLNLDSAAQSWRDQAYQNSLIAGLPVAGSQTWDDLKAAPTIGKVGQFGLEMGASSLVDMMASIATLPVQIGAQTGRIGQERALNDGRQYGNMVDMGIALPFGVGASVLERIGVQGMVAKGAGSVAGQIGKAALKEGGTEFVQSGIEYSGGTVGTEAGFDPATALDQALAGAVGGSTMGAGVNAVVQAGRAGKGAVQDRMAARAEQAAWSPVANEIARNMFSPPQPVTPGVEPMADNVVPIVPDLPVPGVPPIKPPVATPASPTPAAASPAGSSVSQDNTPGRAPLSPKAEAAYALGQQHGQAGLAKRFLADEEERAAYLAGYNGEDAAPPSKPEPAPLAPDEREISTPAGTKIRVASREVIDASELKHAEGADQNRDRSRGSTDVQIQNIISEFDPARLASADLMSDRGAPIIGPDGVIESGNGRVMALRKIFEQYPEQKQAYLDYLQSEGFDVSGKETPILVQRRTSELDDEAKRKYIVESNKDDKLKLTATEQARSDADLLDGDTLAQYGGGDIDLAGNRNFVMAFVKKLTAGEQGGMLDASGNLSQEGVRRVENALMARAYENPEVLEKLLESRDNNIKSIGGALLDNSGGWGSLRAAVKDGEVKPDMDITDQLITAARMVSDARNSGTKPADLVAQTDVFNPMDPVTEALIRAFHDKNMGRAAGRAAISGVIDSYIRRASEQTTGAKLFGGDDMTPAEILQGILAERDSKGTGDMFAADAPLLERVNREEFTETTEAPALPAEADTAEGATDTIEFPPTKGGTQDVTVRSTAGLLKLLDGDLDDTPSKPDYGANDTAMDAYGPTAVKASTTDRISNYDTALTDLGIDVDKFKLLTAPRQSHILQRAIQDKFGIKVTLEKGGKVEGKRSKAPIPWRLAIDQMLDAYQNMSAMAHVLGIPEKAIGLKGALTIHLEKDSSRYLGAYEPGNRRILLPGRTNSFAHEWGHALDYFLLDRFGAEGRGLSGAIRKEGGDTNDTIGLAMIGLMRSLFFKEAELAARVMSLEAQIAATQGAATRKRLQEQLDNIRTGKTQTMQGRSDFYKKAKAFDGDGSDYWQSPTEMMARAFEAYVSFKVEAEGLTTEFIGKGDAAYLSNADERLRETFPKTDERVAIFTAFDNLMSELAYKAAIEAGPAAARPNTTAAKPTTDFVKRDVVDSRSFVTREVDEIRDWMLRRKKQMARPKAPQTKADKAKEVARFWGYSASSSLRSLARKTGSATIMEIHDLITHTPGVARHVGRTFDEAVEMHRNTTVNKLEGILKASGLNRELTPEENTMLRDLLISEDVIDAPDNFVKAAAAIRRLLDEEWHYNREAGIDLGYTRNGHLMRIVDVPLVDGDMEGFLSQAGKVYEIVFDNSWTDADTQMNAVLEEGQTPFWRMVRSIAKRNPAALPSLKDVVKALKEIRKLTAAQAKSDEPDKFDERIGKLVEDLTETFGELYDEAKTEFAIQSAEDWLNKIRMAGVGDFDAHSPDIKYTKKRVLPPETDKLMEKYFINDVKEITSSYLEKSARRAEYVRRMGLDNSKREALAKSMMAEGVSARDQETVLRILDTTFGRNANDIAPIQAEAYAVLSNLYGTLTLLPRAVLSSLAEAATASVVTGNPLDAGRALSAQLGSPLASLIDTIAGTDLGANARHRKELARAMGIIATGAAQNIWNSRFGGDYANTTRTDKWVAAMFRKTGLVALTTAQRTHMIAVTHAWLDNLSGQITEKGADAKDAIAIMTEFGIRDPEAFAARMVERGRMPTVEELADDFGTDYATATNRMINTIIQNPRSYNRPEMASQPIGRLMYGIMSFSYTAWENLIKRSFRYADEKAGRQGNGAKGAAWAAGSMVATAAGYAFLYILQTTVSTLREYITNREKWRELEEADEKEPGSMAKHLAWLGLTRTLGTPVDPLIQGYTGLKYQRDLAYVPLGPALGNIFQNMTALGMANVRNSENTNTAEHRAIQALYSLTLAPAGAAALAAAPGGTLLGAAQGFGIAALTAPGTRKGIATAIVGEKGRKRDKETGEWETEEQMEERAEAKRERAERKKEKEEGGL